MHKVLVTCPPMLGLLHEFTDLANSLDIELVPAKTTQVLSEQALIEQLPSYNGWIIGDDPATNAVFEAAASGELRAAVKWGIGVDNVDFEACKRLSIPITNTPNMFGGEVADIAIGYLVGLARQTFYIDREIRKGAWPKPAGNSISGKHVGVVGFGDIGRQTVKRLSGFDVKATVYDPAMSGSTGFDYAQFRDYPSALGELDYLIFTCSLNKHNRHMLAEEQISKLKPGCGVINVARGALIDEAALIEGLRSERIGSAALDVFEEEPLLLSSPLRSMERCIFGSHNSSNTYEGVIRASNEALHKLAAFLNA